MQFQISSRYGKREFNTMEGGIQACINSLTLLETVIVPKAMKVAMERYLRNVASSLAARHAKPYPDGTGADSLSRRSGAAVASINKSVKVKASSDEVLGSIGGIFYLNAHEDGAIIRPVHAQYLTVPLPAALDARGMPKKLRARDWKNTFIKKSKAGNLIIFQKKGKEIIPLYVLKKSVRIPARLGMGRELKAKMDFLYSQTVAEIIREFKI